MRTKAFAIVVAAIVGLAVAAAAGAGSSGSAVRAAVPPGAIKHVVLIDLENEDYGDTFGPDSPATYLNGTLRAQGELLENYYATSHASLGNYVSQVSGQASTPTTNNDCISLATFPQLFGGFYDVAPGTDADPTRWPGQVVGDGCVFPAPTPTSHGAQTIGDQLDTRPAANAGPHLSWRAYVEDMGNVPSRDYGTVDQSTSARPTRSPVTSRMTSRRSRRRPPSRSSLRISATTATTRPASAPTPRAATPVGSSAPTCGSSTGCR